MILWQHEHKCLHHCETVDEVGPVVLGVVAHYNLLVYCPRAVLISIGTGLVLASLKVIYQTN